MYVLFVLNPDLGARPERGLFGPQGGGNAIFVLKITTNSCYADDGRRCYS